MEMTPRQQKALAALLVSPSRAAAADAAGITVRTLQNYLGIPEFQREYKRAFEEVVVDATRQAQQAISPALSTLREIVEDKEEDAQARISAARAILSNGLKLTETTDILNWLQELETAMEGGHDGKY